eukprot:Lithocolla_globosa_v1_NODE_5231_length_1279_cov_2.781046.p2 type:complete len:144 gc:universal NODE_5231_length_1279_cov_2.781046:617-186(-)
MTINDNQKGDFSSRTSGWLVFEFQNTNQDTVFVFNLNQFKNFLFIKCSTPHSPLHTDSMVVFSHEIKIFFKRFFRCFLYTYDVCVHQLEIRTKKLFTMRPFSKFSWCLRVVIIFVHPPTIHRVGQKNVIGNERKTLSFMFMLR